MNMLNKLAIFLIKIYQKTLSPDKGVFSPWLKWRICTHEPHCSEYAKQCFQKYSFFHALDLTFERVMSCTPSSQKTYDPSSYNIVFFSWAPIGIPFLEAIHKDPRFNITWVVTMPDAASGRWMKTKENIIKKHTKKLSFVHESDIRTPHSLRTTSKKRGKEAKIFEERLKQKAPDYIIVVAYGKIIPQSVLDIPRIAPINVHWSLLPEYRWASPLQSVFLDGKTETWVTVMLMNDKLDEWNMISKLATKIPFTRTVIELIGWIEKHSPTHLIETLQAYWKWDKKSKEQDDTIATLCGKIEKEDGRISPENNTLEYIYQKYRAYILRPKVYFFHNKKRVIIEKMQLDESIYSSTAHQSFFQQDNTLNSAVKELILKPEWKKSMTRDEFKRGYLTR